MNTESKGDFGDTSYVRNFTVTANNSSKCVSHLHTLNGSRFSIAPMALQILQTFIFKRFTLANIEYCLNSIDAKLVLLCHHSEKCEISKRI